MIKLSRKMEYALMALQKISAKQNDELTTAKEIAVSQSIPFDVTSRVLQLMARHNVLKSVQGVQGGYSKVQDLAQISLLDLVTMIDGPQALVRCLDPDEEICEHDEACQLKTPLKHLNAKLIEFCKSVPVQELVRSTGGVIETAVRPTETGTTI